VGKISLELLLAILFLVIAILSGIGAHYANQFPKYTNMTEREAAEQLIMLSVVNAKACHAAGGKWTGGVTDGRCSIKDYPSPDIRWYVTPNPNPLYAIWHPRMAFFMVTCIMTALVSFFLFSAAMQAKYLYRE
jgi:hypothetical protein